MTLRPQHSFTSPFRAAARLLIKFVMPALVLLVSAGCATTQTAQLEGTATFRERIALPPDAIFKAELLELTPVDQPRIIHGRAILDPAGQPPFHFRIAYDETRIRPDRHYAVHATVSAREREFFSTGRLYPVFEGNDAPLELLMVRARKPEPAVEPVREPASYEREVPGASRLMRWHLDLLPGGHYQLRTIHLDNPESNRVDRIGLWRYDQNDDRLTLLRGGEPPLYFLIREDGRILQQVDAEGKPLDSRINTPLRRLPELALIEPRLTLTGMFQYMADAPLITLCDGGRPLPVAMEGDYKALERAYVAAKPQPGQPLLVELEGLIALRPSMEESQPPRPALVVERFDHIWPRERCGQPQADTPLRGSYWKLVRLDGAAVEIAEGQQEPHLIFSTEEMRISGSSGCNRLMGGFEVDDDKLRLPQMAGTMMACLRGMELERRFLDTLGKVQRYRISGSHLEMLDATGTAIARFEAVALR